MFTINTTPQLEEIVQILAKEPAIAIDTEFVRRDTYFAKLCLIQIATKASSYVIDPLGLDLQPFASILTNKKIVKVLHAPSQDLAIFYHVLKVYTHNVFDTQEAAKYCGIKHQISYQEICSRVLGIGIEKQQQFRNWLMRPLPQEMIDYAIQDVTYLLKLYEKLQNEMRAYHSLEKFSTTMDLYNQKEFYIPNLERMWQKIKTTETSRRFTHSLQMIAAFREIAAMQLDLPRQHVINDNAVISIAKNLPTDMRKFSILNVRSRLTSEQLEELFDLCMGLSETENI